jgi:uncharacterized membrane protein YagU involved in acid resistance
MAPSENAPPFRSLAVAALVGGLIAGSLDIVAAVAIYGAGPAKILQGIASGLLGPASFQGGAWTTALGLILQLLMSVIIAAIYVFGALKIPALLQKPTRFGALYGVAIYFVMNFIVVPLSAVPPKPAPTPSAAVLQFSTFLGFGAMIGFGLVIAWTPRLLRFGAAARIVQAKN